MAIHDSDPERRNLIVTSLAFIAYYYAGGAFVDSNVRLQMVNVTFEKPEVLAGIAWMLLFWFFYRYWLTHKKSFRNGFSDEKYDYYKLPYVIRYAEKRLGKPLVKSDEEEGYHITGLVYSGGKAGIRYVYALDITRSEVTGEIEGYTGNGTCDNGVIPLQCMAGYWVMLRATLECCIKSPSFSSYLVPYVIFAVALIGPFSRCWSQH